MNKDIFISEYVSDALAYQSRRREGLFDALFSIGKLGQNESKVRSAVGLIFSELHSSACIIDDMVDHEKIREGLPAFYVRHGNGVAAITALHLMVSSIGRLVSGGVPADIVFDRIGNLVFSEEADAGIVKMPIDESPLSWYLNVSSLKTAYELQLIMDYIFVYADGYVQSTRSVILVALLKLGRIIQMGNDWRDLIENDPWYRSGFSDQYHVTFSLPLAVSSEYFGTNLASSVGAPICRKDFSTFKARVQSREVQKCCVDLMRKEHGSFTDLVISNPGLGLERLVPVAEFVMAGHLWSQKEVRVA